MFAMYIIFGLLLVVGLVFFLIGTAMKEKYKKKNENCTYVADAYVVDYKQETAKGGSVLHYPVLSFEVEGRTYNVKYEYGTQSQVYKIGEQLPVCCSPVNPNKFYIPTDNAPKKLSSTLLTVGIVCITVALLVVVIGFFAI